MCLSLFLEGLEFFYLIFFLLLFIALGILSWVNFWCFILVFIITLMKLCILVNPLGTEVE